MKAYVQMDYLASLGTDYLSASYRDFVPEASAMKRLLGRHLKVVPSLREQRIESIEAAIAKKESIMFRPIRAYIEKQIAAGENMTRSYFARKGIFELKIRKQNWFPYWKVIEEEITMEKEAAEEYDTAALTEIHEWLTHELQNAFGGWSIDKDYDIFIAEDFTATYKIRTFEFGLIRTGNLDAAEVAYAQTYYYIIFAENQMKSYAMWDGFDYMGFFREMRRIGAWK